MKEESVSEQDISNSIVKVKGPLDHLALALTNLLSISPLIIEAFEAMVNDQADEVVKCKEHIVKSLKETLRNVGDFISTAGADLKEVVVPVIRIIPKIVKAIIDLFQIIGNSFERNDSSQLSKIKNSLKKYTTELPPAEVKIILPRERSNSCSF